MEVRYSRDPQSFQRMNTSEISAEFLIADLFEPNEITLVYLHVDRMIVGSAVPTNLSLSLEAGAELRAEYFAERREIGVLNIGEQGSITVDGQEYGMAHREMLYIGRGGQEISLASADASRPAPPAAVRPRLHATRVGRNVWPSGRPRGTRAGRGDGCDRGSGAGRRVAAGPPLPPVGLRP